MIDHLSLMPTTSDIPAPATVRYEYRPPIAAKTKDGATYIGRGTPFGNPFRVSDVVSAETAVRAYRLWIWQEAQRPLRNEMMRLAGRRLFCPGCQGRRSPCHGQVIAEVIRVGVDLLNARR